MKTPEEIKEHIEPVRDSLVARHEFEEKAARLDLIRNLEDRPEVQSWPWPRASNLEDSMCDDAITDWKAFYTAFLERPEPLYGFTGLLPELQGASGKVAAGFDYYLRYKTNFTKEIKFASDDFAHMGFDYMKVFWSDQKKRLKFLQINYLFIIRPRVSQLLEDDPWIVHVIQLSEKALRKRFKGRLTDEEIDSFIDKVKSENTEHDQSNTREQEDDRVGVEGVGFSGKGKADRFVLWEKHYLDENDKRRIITLSPDVQDMDFKDDRPYPKRATNTGWMIKEGLREYKHKRAYMSRGITELGNELQQSKSGIWRGLHNDLNFSLARLWKYKDGQMPPGVNQNSRFSPGQIVPGDVEEVALRPTNIQFWQEMQNIDSRSEKRLSSPSVGLTQDGVPGGDSRTATEVSFLQQNQSNSVNQFLGNWNDHLWDIGWEAWNVLAAHKSEIAELQFMFQNKLTQIEQEAISTEFLFSVANSSENINLQIKLQKADMVLNRALQLQPLGIANVFAAWQKWMDLVMPQWTQDVVIEPQIARENEIQKALADIEMIVELGEQPEIDESSNHSIAAQTAFEWLTHERNLSGLDFEKVGIIAGYGQAHNELALRAGDPQAQERAALFEGFIEGIQNITGGGNGNGQASVGSVPQEQQESAGIGNPREQAPGGI